MKDYQALPRMQREAYLLQHCLFGLFFTERIEENSLTG